MHVLVVEDEQRTASFIKKALLAETFCVDVIHRGDEVVPFASITQFDVIVLDIMLPGCDGISVLKQLRSSKILTPVLLLSARGEVRERIDGLNAGADDYLPKPFSISELVARIRALARRTPHQQSKELYIDNLVLNLDTRKATRGGNIIELSTREFTLLQYLMERPDRICSRSLILEQVWGYSFDPGTNIVDVYIRRIREKIHMADHARLLHTVRGSGYVLSSDK